MDERDSNPYQAPDSGTAPAAPSRTSQPRTSQNRNDLVRYERKVLLLAGSLGAGIGLAAAILGTIGLYRGILLAPGTWFAYFFLYGDNAESAEQLIVAGAFVAPLFWIGPGLAVGQVWNTVHEDWIRYRERR